MTILKRGEKRKAFSILLAITLPLLLLAFVGLQLAGAAGKQSTAFAVDSANLGIAKVVAPELVVAGEQLTYTLTVSNSGTLSATNVVVSDSLPVSVTIARMSTNVDEGTCDDSSDPIVCLLGDLEVAASALITFLVDVDPGFTGVMVNDAEVSSDSVDDDGSNNTASASATAIASADLSLDKTATAATVVAGEHVTYTLNISNAGPSDATGVIISDTLPQATTYISASDASCSKVVRTILCPLSSPLEAGTSTIITLVLRVNPEVLGLVTNDAEVGSDASDNSPGDNFDSTDVTVIAEADLSLIKTAATGAVGAGGSLTYTLGISNAGPSVATGVTISDTLPPSTTYISASGASCSDVNNLLDCSLANPLGVNSGAVITLVVEVDADASGILTNYAEVSSDAIDNSPENNHGSAVVTVGAEADLSLVKTASSGMVIAGEPLTYTLSISNAGPSDATGVVVSDTLPPGTSFMSAGGASCSEDNNLLDCSLSSPLTANTGAVVTLVVDVDSDVLGPLTNYAEVGSDANDYSPGDNLDSALVTVSAEADLSLVKTASSASVASGERLTYTLTIFNAGPSDATSVAISDTLPPETSFVSASGASCSRIGNLLDCSLSSPLTANTGAVITVVVDVDSEFSGTVTNYAEVSSDADDSSLGDNVDEVSTLVQISIFRTYIPIIQQGIPPNEPNDTCQQAFGIVTNVDYWFMPDNVFNWYEFDLTSAGTVIVELTNFTPLKGQVAAYEGDNGCASRKPIGNVGDPGLTKILHLGHRQPGHYYVVVASDGPLSDTTPFRLRVSVKP